MLPDPLGPVGIARWFSDGLEYFCLFRDSFAATVVELFPVPGWQPHAWSPWWCSPLGAGTVCVGERPSSRSAVRLEGQRFVGF